MKRLLLATAASAVLGIDRLGRSRSTSASSSASPARSKSITPGMAAAAELAFKEASDSGKLPGGITLTPIRADSTCIDAAAATTAAQQLVTRENVAAIVGADCSGVTTAIANNVAVPERRGDGLALGDLAGALHDRGRRLLLPHRAVRRPPGRDPRRRWSRRRASTTSRSPSPTTTTARASPTPSPPPSRPPAARWRSPRRTRTARATIPPRSRRCRPPAPRRWWSSATSTRAASASSRPRSTPAPSSSFFFGDGMYGQSLIDSIGDEINGKVIGTLPGVEGEAADKFAARRQGRRAWTRPAPTCRRATTPRR